MKCIIIGPLWQGEDAAFLRAESGDFTLCADGGLDAALRHGLRPDLVIGDFDSMPFDHAAGYPTLTLPVEKDDTDTAVCVREARRRGYRRYHVGGCLGGRLDHTLANIQLAADCAAQGEELWLCDDRNRLTVYAPGAYTLHPMPGRKLSLLAFTERVEGVTLTGTHWPLVDAALTSRYPLGVSNEITAGEAHLRFTSGMMMVVWSGDKAE